MINIAIPKTDIVHFQKILDIDNDKFAELLRDLNQLELKEEIFADLIKIGYAEDFSNFIFTLVNTLSNTDSKEQKEDILGKFYTVFSQNEGSGDSNKFIQRINDIYKNSVSIRNLFQIYRTKGTADSVKEIESKLSMTPIFEKENNTLIANIIWYKLKFEYIENQSIKSICLNFDTETLDFLKKAIEKLEKQNEIISKSFVNTDLKLIG